MASFRIFRHVQAFWFYDSCVAILKTFYTPGPEFTVRKNVHDQYQHAATDVGPASIPEHIPCFKAHCWYGVWLLSVQGRATAAEHGR